MYMVSIEGQQHDTFFSYSQQDAVGDLVAGITVGLTVIPQALAYSGIAGLSPAVIFYKIVIVL